jgi:hypothetical protein
MSALRLPHALQTNPGSISERLTSSAHGSADISVEWLHRKGQVEVQHSGPLPAAAPLKLGRVDIGKPLQIAGWRRQGCNVCLTARTACPSNLYLASDRAKKSSCFHGVVGIVRCSRRPPAFALHAPPRQAGRNTKDEGGLWSYRVEVLAPEMRTKNLGARA